MLIAQGSTARPKVADKVQELILLYIEVDEAGPVTGALLESCTTSKKPKVPGFALKTMRAAIEAFGTRKIPFQPLAAALPKLLGSTNTATRKESMLMVETLYSWLRDECGFLLPSISVPCLGVLFLFLFFRRRGSEGGLALSLSSLEPSLPVACACFDFY